MQACGVPVVVSPVSGTVELVEDGLTGLFVTPGDREGLVAAICSLLKDEALGKKMGITGRKKVDEGYSWESVVKATLPVYEVALDRAKWR